MSHLTGDLKKMTRKKLTSKVYIGFGSNLGDRRKNIESAYALIRQHCYIELVRHTSFKETKPWGVTDQPLFINSIAEIKTSLTPCELLKELKIIEKKSGRGKVIKRWGPRVIDLDILLFNSVILNTPDLKIPHIQLTNRDFIIDQLLELDPDIVHPLHAVPLKKL